MINSVSFVNVMRGVSIGVTGGNTKDLSTPKKVHEKGDVTRTKDGTERSNGDE